MEFTIDQTRLVPSIGWAAYGFATHPMIPILAGARLDVSGDQLTVTGYDHDTCGVATAEVTTSHDGTAVVSGRLLYEIVKALPPKPVRFTVGPGRAEITCGGAQFSLPTLPDEDYPPIPQMPTVEGTASATEFVHAVNAVAVAASRDETIPLLTGIQCDLSPGHLTLRATDRYRMAVRRIDWRGDTQPRTVSVPSRSLSTIGRAIAASGTEVGLGLSDTGGLVGLRVGRRHLTCRVLDGQIPDMTSILAGPFRRLAEVATADLNQALRRISLVAGRQTRIAMAFGDSGIEVSSGGGEAMGARETVAAQVSDTRRIEFNAGYLADGVAAVDSPVGFIDLDDRSGRIRLSGDSGAETFSYLMQPLRPM